jgi:Uma2 family endonuclease
MSILADEMICPLPQVELIETDGEPLESDWHRLEMNLLIEVVTVHMGETTDFFVGGNMFIYFNEQQARDRDFRGPDFFFVRGVPLNPPRPYWAVWKERGKYPDLIIELSSPSTIKEDLTTKKDIYEKTFHTHEYICFNPFSGRLDAWRLIHHRFEPIVPDERGWLWCEELGLWLGPWRGKFQGKEDTYLRFYDKQGNLVPTIGEAEQAKASAEQAKASAAQQQAKAAQQQAEAAQQQAEAAQQQAEAARLQAATERKRAEAAEGELARLRAQSQKAN